jgi:hypothetical protein
MLDPREMKDEELSTNEFIANKQMLMMKSYDIVRSNLKVAAERRKKTYDFKVKQTEFLPNQKVWYYYPRRYVKRSQKFQCMYTGPYVVVRKIGELNYLIQKDSKSNSFVVHVDKLKAYVEVPSVRDSVNEINVNRLITDDCVVIADRPEYTNCAKEEEMAPTKGSYACKECGKMTMGADAHHQHQRRCRSKKLKGNSTVVINTEVVASETPASEVAYTRYDESDGDVQFCGNILTTQDSSEDQQSKENLMILSSGVWFDPRDLNLQKIQTDGASIVDISSCEVATCPTFQHVPPTGNCNIDTIMEEWIQEDSILENFLINVIASGDTPLQDEDVTYVMEGVMEVKSVANDQATYSEGTADTLGQRIDRIMNEGLVMGGTTQIEEPDIDRQPTVESEKKEDYPRDCSENKERRRELEEERKRKAKRG